LADVEILYDPITVNSGPVGVTLYGLDNIKADTTFTVPKPIETKSGVTLSVPDTVKTDTKLTFAFPDTIKTDSASAIDLQPVVVDQCLRLSLGPLPPTLICLPNRQHVGLTLFGVEVFGLTLDGEARVVVSDLPKPPVVVSAPQAHHPHHDDHDDADTAHPAAREARPPFVIRLGG
jgi:hypothetical protein